MSSSSQLDSRSSLARATLLKMGMRIAVVIALSTLFSYLHLVKTLRDQALVQLKEAVAERTQREQSIFVLAQDNHALLKKALAERLEAWSHQDPTERFNQLFETQSDGAVRNRPQGFDGTKMVGLFSPRGVPLDT